MQLDRRTDHVETMAPPYVCCDWMVAGVRGGGGPPKSEDRDSLLGDSSSGRKSQKGQARQPTGRRWAEDGPGPRLRGQGLGIASRRWNAKVRTGPDFVGDSPMGQAARRAGVGPKKGQAPKKRGQALEASQARALYGGGPVSTPWVGS